MENPYTPPAEITQDPKRSWVRTLSSVVSGCLSLLMLIAIVSNALVFVGIERQPIQNWQLLGIVTMTAVMVLNSAGFGMICIGLIRFRALLLKRGLWVVCASVVGYALVVMFSLVMRAAL